MSKFVKIKTENAKTIMRNIGPHAYAIYSYLLMNRNSKTNSTENVNLNKIIDDTGIGHTSISKYLSILEQEGFLTIIRTVDDNHQHGVNKYLFPKE